MLQCGKLEIIKQIYMLCCSNILPRSVEELRLRKGWLSAGPILFQDKDSSKRTGIPLARTSCRDTFKRHKLPGVPVTFVTLSMYD